MTFCRRFSTLVVVDSTVADYQSLVNSTPSEAAILILDPNQDGIEQITQVLAKAENIESLHILSHGSVGALQLGSANLNWQTLNRYASQLRAWAKALSGAEILLYGCEVAAGAIGQWFVRQLKSLTGAEIAASTNLTGNSDLGGDWTLEFATGHIHTPLAFSGAAMASYSHVLATLVTDTFRNGDVVDKNWLFGIDPPASGQQPSQLPFLTARGIPTAPTGGIPGSPSGVALDPEGEGALRLTGALGNQAAFVLYNNPVPTSQGLTITFELYAYGGNTDPRADGVSFFLLDGTASPRLAGAFGGSLGYAQKEGIAPGIEGGYIGIGFDEFGNFSSATDAPGEPPVREGGQPQGRVPDSIGIRGSGNEQSGYRFLAGTDTLPFGIDNPNATNREEAKRKIQVELTPTGLLTVRIDGNNDGDFLDPFESDPDLTDIDVAQLTGTATPSTIKFGFASGTGLFNNIHEIRNLFVGTLNNPPQVFSFAETLLPGTTIILDGASSTDPSDGFFATDPDIPDGDFIQSFQILTLPDPAQGTLFVGDPLTGGVPVTIGTTLTPEQIQTIYFQSTSGFSGATFTYTATDSRGTEAEVPATVTLNLRDPNNNPPNTNPSELRLPRSTARLVPGLSGTDLDGDDTIQFFQILTVPPANEGQLFLGDPAQGGTPITQGQRLTPTEITQVFFQSSSTFNGSSFTYAAIDDQGEIDPTPATVNLIFEFGRDPVSCPPGRTFNGNNRDNKIDGTPLFDQLRGFAGNDRIRGFDCNDILQGGRGNDVMAGGADRDVLKGQQNNDVARGNAGDDVIDLGLGRDRGFGGKGDDIVDGRRGDDRIEGRGGNDNLRGGKGKDKLNGGPNQDFLDGQQGNDELKGGKGDDTMNGGLGQDRLRGSRKFDRVTARRGNDVAWGGPGNDALFGNRGNDRLSGNTQADRLLGGFGNDILTGGGGSDEIRTGAGADRINYRSALHGVDTIVDFNVARDLINLRRIFNKPEYGNSDRFRAYVRLRDGDAGAILRVDSNGDAAGGFVRLAILQGVEVASINPTTNFLV
jgi:Ca2+-binding RTX toxin-like protein